MTDNEVEEPELETAAYEVWCREDGEEKMELMRELPEKATVHNELVRKADAEEHGKLMEFKGISLARKLATLSKDIEDFQEKIESKEKEIAESIKQKGEEP